MCLLLYCSSLSGSPLWTQISEVHFFRYPFMWFSYTSSGAILISWSTITFITNVLGMVRNHSWFGTTRNIQSWLPKSRSLINIFCLDGTTGESEKTTRYAYMPDDATLDGRGCSFFVRRPYNRGSLGENSVICPIWNKLVKKRAWSIAVIPMQRHCKTHPAKKAKAFGSRLNYFTPLCLWCSLLLTMLPHKLNVQFC